MGKVNHLETKKLMMHIVLSAQASSPQQIAEFSFFYINNNLKLSSHLSPNLKYNQAMIGEPLLTVFFPYTCTEIPNSRPYAEVRIVLFVFRWEGT